MDSCRKPLDYAAQLGDVEAARLLLDFGADPNAGSTYFTAITTAAYKGYTAVVWLLLERGARFDDEDDADKTPVDYAVGSDNKAMIRDFIETTIELEREGKLKKLLLEAAVAYKRIGCIEMVLEKGPLPELTESFGSELLYRAMTGYKPPKDIVELLLDKGAKPMQEGQYGRKEMLGKTRIDKEWLAQKTPSLFTA